MRGVGISPSRSVFFVELVAEPEEADGSSTNQHKIEHAGNSQLGPKVSSHGLPLLR